MKNRFNKPPELFRDFFVSGIPVSTGQTPESWRDPIGVTLWRSKDGGKDHITVSIVKKMFTGSYLFAVGMAFKAWKPNRPD